MPSVAESMKAARINQGMTIKRLSELSGITPGAICKIECGVNKPNLTTIEILADILGLTIDEYVGHVKVKGNTNFRKICEQNSHFNKNKGVK